MPVKYPHPAAARLPGRSAYSRPPQYKIARQTGAALVLVIMIVAVISIAAVTINEHVRYETWRLQNQRANEQAYWYALGGEVLAVRLLREFVGEPTIHGAQAWATRDAVFPIDGGAIYGQISDQQACFNINNLQRAETTDPTQQIIPTPQSEQFRHLLGFLEIPLEKAEQLNDRLHDWIDRDMIPQGVHGAEDLYYSSLKPAYQPPNHLAISVSELALMVELEREEMLRLRQHLCALPAVDTGVNINTLEPEQAAVLAGVFLGVVSVEEAVAILETRPEAGWESVAEFLSEPLLQGKEIREESSTALTVTSRYFRAEVLVNYREVQFHMSSQLTISEDSVRSYSREYGQLL